MINDLTKGDVKLSLTVRSDDDRKRLQTAIDNIVNCRKDSFLQFNAKKCDTITFSHAHNPIVQDYNIDGVLIIKVTEVGHLGVSLSPGLSFNDHIVRCYKKVYRNLRLICVLFVVSPISR